MGNIGDPLTQVIPTVGVTTGPDYAALVNAVLEEVKARLEAKVAPGSMSISSDLDFVNHEAENVGAVGLQDRAAAPTGIAKLYLLNDEFYVLDGLGRSVKITSAGALNAAGLAGIGGDYGGGNPALVAYVDASSVFVFTQDPGSPADLDAGDVKVRQKTGSNFATTLKPSAALAANESRFLAPKPASGTKLLLIDSTGQESTTDSPSLVAGTFSGAVTVSTLAAATWVSTSEADIRFTNRVRMLSPAGAVSLDFASGWTHQSATSPQLNSAGAGQLFQQLDVINGETLTSVSVRIRDSASTVTLRVYKMAILTGVITQLGATQTSTGTTSNQTLSVSGLSEAVSSLNNYYIVITANGVGQSYYGGTYQASRP